MHQPITQTMAAYLKALVARTPLPADMRTASVLERRKYVEAGAITQLGRETLGMFYHKHAKTSPSTITSCTYWNTFYGWKGFIVYADTPDQRTLVEFRFRLPAYHHNLEAVARRAVLHELTKVRHLSLDRAPQMIEEPVDDYDEE